MSSNKITPIVHSDLNPEVLITEEAYKKIMHWIHKAGTKEVSGLGNVVYDKEEKTFRVNEVYLLEQENTATTTDLDSEAVGKLIFDHIKSGIEGELNFWWHSHVDMNVFWSQTDLQTIEELGDGGWFLSTVFNKKEETRSAFYQTEPFASFVDNLPTNIEIATDENQIADKLLELGLSIKKGFEDQVLQAVEQIIPSSLKKDWNDEFEDKVKVKTFAFSSGGSSVTHGWNTPLLNKPESPLSGFPGFNSIPKTPDLYDLTYDPMILDYKSNDDFTTRILKELRENRAYFHHDEIIDMYQNEFTNIKDVLQFLEEEEQLHG